MNEFCQLLDIFGVLGLQPLLPGFDPFVCLSGCTEFTVRRTLNWSLCLRRPPLSTLGNSRTFFLPLHHITHTLVYFATPSSTHTYTLSLIDWCLLSNSFHPFSLCLT